MHELERIEAALEAEHIEHRLFERFAQDALSELFPGLVPIPRGTDWGRDADIVSPDDSPPRRLLVTASRSLDGVRDNLRRGIQSMIDHGLEFDELVLCNLGQLGQLDRVKLNETAERKGARLPPHFIFDRQFVASRLRRDGEWRERLLGLSADPITLARSPASLVESPWASLPLVGRDSEVERIRGTDSDLIVTGPPGVGKSRLLAEIPGLLFVDRDAALGRLSDDIRWLQPEMLAVDDAGDSGALLRHLVRLRQVEGDIAQYQIVAVCWPDEVTSVRILLPGAETMELDLLEREAVDQVIRSLGIDGSIARSEILDQAEGRPGWAVALADLLISSKDVTSLLSGQALLGEVEAFIRRSRADSDIVALLTIIAALGSIREDELSSLQTELDLSRAALADRLRRAATSGLVDVVPVYDWATSRYFRTYIVRPPMLARALVAEQVFRSDVPVLDLADLASRWPGSVVELAHAATHSALLGADNARATAASLFHVAVESDQVSAEQKLALCGTFGMIDPAASSEVLALIASALDDVYRLPESDYWKADPLLDVIKRIARRYASEEAMTILLDASVSDTRPTNRHTSHPTRALEDLLHDFHPELPAPEVHRTVLASVLASWLDAENASEAQWVVFGDQVENLLSFSLGSAYTAPENPHTVQLIQTVVRPAEMTRIYDEIWPTIRPPLNHAPVAVIARVVDAAVDWLRVGAGFDRPFGGAHPAESITTAADLAKRLVGDLAPFTGPHTGLARKLQSAAEPLGIQVRVEASDSNAAFFLDVERGRDWKESVDQLQSDISAVVTGWSLDDPSPVLDTLAEIKKELDVAGITWPDRIRLAFAVVAESVEQRSTWIEACLDASMFPHAGPLLNASVEAGEVLSMELWRRCWSNPGSRWEALHIGLHRPPSEDVYEGALEEIDPGDYRLIETLVIRDELTTEALRALLTRPSDTARGAVAAAMFDARRNDDSWTPGELEEEWMAAIVELDFAKTLGFANWSGGRLFTWLAAERPETLVALVHNRLGSDEAAIRYDALPHDGWDALHRLPAEHKTKLWSDLFERSGHTLLREHLVGEDAAWLKAMLDAGHFNVDDALASYSGFGPHPRIEDLAKVLVPRGVDPERIAGLAQSGTWTGEESHRYTQLAERFQDMADSDDTSVAAVGKAGHDMYVRARDTALEDERLKRVRGDL